MEIYKFLTHVIVILIVTSVSDIRVSPHPENLKFPPRRFFPGSCVSGCKWVSRFLPKLFQMLTINQFEFPVYKHLA